MLLLFIFVCFSVSSFTLRRSRSLRASSRARIQHEKTTRPSPVCHARADTPNRALFHYFGRHVTRRLFLDDWRGKKKLVAAHARSNCFYWTSVDSTRFHGRFVIWRVRKFSWDVITQKSEMSCVEGEAWGEVGFSQPRFTVLPGSITVFLTISVAQNFYSGHLLRPIGRRAI